MIDLEKLERLHAEATPGPWTQRGNFIFCAQNKRLAYVEAERALDLQTAAYIVAACNSLPDLIAENRALQERVQTLEREIGDCNSEVSYWREEYEGEVQFAEDRIRELERQKKLLAAKVVEISNVKFCKDCKFRGPCYLNNAKVTEDTNVCVEAVIYWTEQTSKEVKSE